MASGSTSNGRNGTSSMFITEQSPNPKGIIDLTAPNQLSSTHTAPKRKFEVIDLTQDDEDIGTSSKKYNTKKYEEKRLRLFRKKPPRTFLDRLERVMTQRMFLIDRNRRLGADGTYEEEIFDIAGSTGNVYQITISKEPKCTCPDAEKGNQCKHIIYVLINVLKAQGHLAYQLAFLTAELAELFARAPATPQSSSQADPTSTDTGGNRKSIEGDCPVCVMEFDEGDDIVWCKAACGNNIHRQCFEQWARSKPGQVKCVYCRMPWKGDDSSITKITGGIRMVNEEGYVNIASELGISRQRDTRTYYQPWVRGQHSGHRNYDHHGY